MKKLIAALLLLTAFSAHSQTTQPATLSVRSLNPGVSRLDSLQYTFSPGKVGGPSWLYNAEYIRAIFAKKVTTDSIKNNQRVNVRQFGAKGDSVTNDIAAFRACRDYCYANGKSMYVDKGNYVLNDTLIFSMPYFSLITDGRDAVKFIYPGAGVIINGIRIVNTHDVSFGDFTVVRKNVTGSLANNGLIVLNSKNILLGNYKVSGRGNAGISINQASSFVYLNSLETKNTASELFTNGQGLLIDNASDIYANYIKADSAKSAVDVNMGGNRIYINRIEALNCNDNGVDLGSCSNSYFGSIYVKDMFKFPVLGSQNNQGVEIKIENVDSKQFKGSSNNYFGSIVIEGNFAQAIRFGVTSTGTSGSTAISNNVFNSIIVTSTNLLATGLNLPPNGSKNVINYINININKNAVSGAAASSGLEIQGGLIKSAKDVAVNVERVKNFRLLNTSVTSDSLDAVIVNRSDSVYIKNNDIYSVNKNGIFLTDATASPDILPTNIEIENNRFNVIGKNAVAFSSRSTAYTNKVGLKIKNNIINNANGLSNATASEQYGIAIVNNQATAITGLNIDGNKFFAATTDAFKGTLLSGAFNFIGVRDNDYYNINTFFTGSVGAKGVYKNGVDTVTAATTVQPWAISGSNISRNSGNVFINSTSGLNKLTVGQYETPFFTSQPEKSVGIYGDGAAYQLVRDVTNNVEAILLTNSSGGLMGTTTNHAFNLRTNNTNRVTISNGGVVGIPDLTASLPVKTDASKNLISAQIATSDIANGAVTTAKADTTGLRTVLNSWSKFQADERFARLLFDNNYTGVNAYTADGQTADGMGIVHVTRSTAGGNKAYFGMTRKNNVAWAWGISTTGDIIGGTGPLRNSLSAIDSVIFKLNPSSGAFRLTNSVGGVLLDVNNLGHLKSVLPAYSSGSYLPAIYNSTNDRFETVDLLNNAALTGVPIAPTATAGTNTTQIATTQFVLRTSGRQFRYTASGDGVSTTISHPHGLASITTGSSVIIQPMNLATAGVLYATVDATNIYITYSVAPALGTNNLEFTASIAP